MDLSILIPARNEIFLAKTIENILENIQGDTEVIAVCDGYWPKPEIKDHKRVTLVHYTESIGQRAATNVAAKISRAKYLLKCDAHCAFAKGFDVQMLADMQDDFTMVPIMRNLHAFDWVCADGHRRYQGPSGVCKECGKETKMDVVWIAKNNPQSTSYCFDPEPHFQYFNEFKNRPESKGDLTETMSLQGSCFMCTRNKYFELGLCSEEFGSWGSQGIEVACRTWLSGGRVIVNHKTFYAHMFRTQGQDFGFPYVLSGKQVVHAKKSAKDLFFNNKWEKQVKPLSWLIEKFWPIPGWNQEDLDVIRKIDLPFKSVLQDQIDMNYNKEIIMPNEMPSFAVNISTSIKGLVYYTDNNCEEKILSACQNQLKVCCNGNQLVSVSLQPINFGENIVLNEKRSALTMFKQILAGLEKIKSEVVFLVEHDVLYSKEHFDFMPFRKDIIYYNENIWFLRISDGHAMHYDCKQTSGLCAYRDILIKHYKERVNLVEKEGYSNRIGYEPMTHNRIKWNNIYKAEGWKSLVPNIDIRHGKNLSGARWRKDQYRNQHLLINWTESDNGVPGWGNNKNIFIELTKEI